MCPDVCGTVGLYGGVHVKEPDSSGQVCIAAHLNHPVINKENAKVAALMLIDWLAGPAYGAVHARPVWFLIGRNPVIFP